MRTRPIALWLCLSTCSGGGPPAPKAPDAAKSTVVLNRASEVANDTSELEAVVTGLDADGQPVPGIGVKVELSGTGNGVRFTSPSPVLDPNARATALLRSQIAEEKTVTVTLTQGGRDVVLDAKPKVTFVAGGIDRVRFVGQPSNVRVGIVMAPLGATVLDRFGNVVHAPPLTVMIRMVEGTPGAVLSGGDAKTTVDGGVTFDMLTIDRAGSGYGLQLQQVGSPGFSHGTERFDVTL